MEDKELEDQLVEVGTKLLESPPPAIGDLLQLLNQIESCLVKVEQSPSNSMLTALRPSVKALVVKDILKHPDLDVNVAVASCISEITRITAPDAPYEDDMMKDIFQIIVKAFENLDDLSSVSYGKRVSILETVAKVRSCVVMLDLECDALILEMFQHFFRAIRESHPENVFSSVETIMTLVIEESEDISSELLLSILSRIKIEYKDVSPIAFKLGEKVVANCAEKLKPYLIQEIQSSKILLNDYSKVVTSICKETQSTPQNNESEVSGQHMVDENKQLVKTDSNVVHQEPEKVEPEAHPEDDDPQVNNSTTTVMSNAGSDQATRRTRKSVVATHSMETHEDSRRRKKGRSKEADNSHFEGSTLKDTTLSENEKKLAVPSSSGLLSKNVSNISPSANQDISEGFRAKRGRPMSKKRSGSNAEANRTALSPEVKDDENTDEAPKSPAITSKDHEGNDDLDLKKDPEGISDSEERLLRRFSNKARAAITGRESSVKLQGDKTKRRKGTTTTDKIMSGESSQKHVKKSSIDDKETPKAKSKRRIPVLEKPAEDLGEKLVDSRVKVWWPDDKRYYKGVVASFDPVEKKHKIIYDDGDEETLRLRDEKWLLIEVASKIDAEQTSDGQSPDDASEIRRKKKARASSGSSSKPGRLESTLKRSGGSASKLKDVSEKAANKSKGMVDEGKLGSKSEEGTSKSGGKSKVDNTKASGRSKDNTSNKLKDDKPKTDNKSKDESPKTLKKSKDDATKEGSKPKEEMLKISSKSKDNTPKTESKSKDEASKSKDHTPRTGSKFKDDLAKIGHKSKYDGHKGGGKLKGSTLKTVSKTSANGTSAKGKSAVSKASEDTAKGKSLSSAKVLTAEEGDTKSGKKRRRGMQG